MRFGTVILIFCWMVFFAAIFEPPCLSADMSPSTKIGCSLGRAWAEIYYGFEAGFGEWND